MNKMTGFTTGFKAFCICCVLFAIPAAGCKIYDVPDLIVVPIGLIVYTAIFLALLPRKGKA